MIYLVKSSRNSVLWLALLIALSLPFGTSAESPEGIDLVVLIDQSGSMWGHPEYHPRANDRYAHRVGSTRAVLQRLIDDIKGTSRIHRFSIVDFGDEAEVSWSNEVLRHDPADPLALPRRLDIEMSHKVVARQWLNTNTPAALAVALSELRKMDAGEHWPGRRKVVLLITDGRPQLPPASPAQLKERVSQQARELFAEDAELWVVGLNDGGDYWLKGDGAFWQELVGNPDRTHLADRAVPELPKGVHRMVDEWLNVAETQSVDSSGTYEAPPYLGRLAFRVTFEKPRQPDSVRIISPEGRAIPRVSSGGPANPSTEARFLLEDPPPGKYEVINDQGPLLIVPEPHPPKIHRIAPTTGADLEVESRVIYEVSMGSGSPLEPMDNWPLAVQLLVESPRGDTAELSADFESPGKIVSRWRPTAPGIYRLKLIGKVGFGGETLDVFGEAPGATTEVAVSNARPLWLKVERPSLASGIRVAPWDRTTDLRLSLIDSAGERVEPTAVLADTEGFLKMELLDPSGVGQGVPISLQVSDRGHFEGRLPIEPDWWHSDGLLGLGEVYLRLHAETERLPEDLVLRGVQLPQEIETARVEGDPFTVGPVPIWLSRAMTLGFLGLLVISALVVLGYLMMRVVPTWRIRRRDVAAGRSVKLRIYDIASDPSGAQAEEKPVTGRASFTFDGHRLMINGETLVADQLRLSRLDAPGKPRARLIYRWRGEKKAKVTLLTVGGGPKILKVEDAVKGRPVADLVENT